MTEQHDTRTTPLVRLAGADVTRAGARLLSGVDFSLMAGARWAVLGANGAGKTTFLRLLRGELQPDLGAHDARTYDLPGQGGPQRTPLGLRQRQSLRSGHDAQLRALVIDNAHLGNTYPLVSADAIILGMLVLPSRKSYSSSLRA